ncbi:MAG: MmcQ/YjbR family DNA-binding protein [Rhizomicrobium sp.]
MPARTKTTRCSPEAPPKYAAVKRIALGLPGAREVVDRHGHWFNVGSRTFALYGMPSARWVFKLPHHQQMMLFDARPQTFAPMRAGRLFWAYVAVENLDGAELKDLLVAAWRMVATKKIRKQYDEGEAG